jgi:hypothetical protein
MAKTGFFRIDRRTWAAVCERGMNPAVSYLVLACGTGRDNRTTAWSAQAVAEYAGIAWVRSKPAIQELVKVGLVKQTHLGSRPRYELPDWEEVRTLVEKPISDYSVALYRMIVKEGAQPKGKLQRVAAEELAQSGKLVTGPDGCYVAAPIDDAPKADHYIWLPTSLVTGTAKGEDSPLARVRRTQDPLTLRLLIDLYHAQHLRDDGGISRSVLSQEFKRSRVGERGIYIVWSFAPSQRWVFSSSITLPHWKKETENRLVFWDRLQQLTDLGLVELIPHLCESEKPDGEIIHPYGIDWRTGELEGLENRAGLAAHRAGLEMRDKRQPLTFGEYLAPVPRDYSEVAMVGIGRLRYRPHTKLTSQWWAKLQTRLPGIISHYEALQMNATNTPLDIKGSQGVSRDLNGVQGLTQ